MHHEALHQNSNAMFLAGLLKIRLEQLFMPQIEVLLQQRKTLAVQEQAKSFVMDETGSSFAETIENLRTT
jgi:hypothetical protein